MWEIAIDKADFYYRAKRSVVLLTRYLQYLGKKKSATQRELQFFEEQLGELALSTDANDLAGQTGAGSTIAARYKMAWENRGNRRYLYHKRKVGDKVRSEYVGSGYAALLSEQLTKAERLDAERKRLEWQAIKDEQAALDEIVDDMTAVSQLMVTAVLLATGHHLHKRQWRKKRNGE